MAVVAACQLLVISFEAGGIVAVGSITMQPENVKSSSNLLLWMVGIVIPLSACVGFTRSTKSLLLGTALEPLSVAPVFSLAPCPAPAPLPPPPPAMAVPPAPAALAAPPMLFTTFIVGAGA